ncbi:hypothetical protein RM704_05375 [Streptomyces sp. DSM 3412]|uniref:Secreted protein n=1 Tax=Streptomyces gottesmaniae TaxID=3075518 RepID=A0ABU2YU43_9ACTN|nr:hypothetical protein [Streptomyces sp. DSM 3412]MDT0566924.1 hypothetical protein [Streptomyces sp. DSM 3412]
MRKFTATAALLGLAALGVVVPAATSQAADSAVAGPGCDSKWGPRNGYMYAWDGYDCSGAQLIATPNTVGDWGSANWDRASSVMNRGYTGSLAIVKFYEWEGHAEGTNDGHACLQPGELYADNLSDNRLSDGSSADNNIRSHKWVNGGCATNLT